jgi:hypothetical protein
MTSELYEALVIDPAGDVEPNFTRDRCQPERTSLDPSTDAILAVTELGWQGIDIRACPI